MIHGTDTGFLVAVEIVEHADHAAARVLLARLLEAGDRLALAPQVLAEFMHIGTDARRFARPFDMPTARGIALQWWTAREIEQIYPDRRPRDFSSPGWTNIVLVASDCSTPNLLRRVDEQASRRC